MSPLLRQAEEILETASAGCQEIAIVIDRQGNVRILEPAGWSLPALRIEFGAAAVYKVERRGNSVRVEGWDGDRSCRIEKTCRPQARRSILPVTSRAALPMPGCAY